MTWLMTSKQTVQLSDVVTLSHHLFFYSLLLLSLQYMALVTVALLHIWMVLYSSFLLRCFAL